MTTILLYGLRILGVALIAALLLLGLFYLISAPPRTPSVDGGLAAFEAHVEALNAKNHPPGLSAVVVQGGSLVYAEGFGTQDGVAASSPDTVYHWWSITKVATAVAVLQLAEEGLLELDAPVADYLPEMQLVYPGDAPSPITVRQLLSHTSGLGDYIPALIGWMHFEEEIYDQTALLQQHLPNHNRLKTAPGTEAAYTNLGYHMLGAVIESVTDMSYETYVVERVLAPLEMTGTGFLYQPDLAAHEARGSQPFFDMFTPLLPFIADTGALYDGRNGASWWTHRVYIDVTPSTGLIGSAREAALLGNALLEGGSFAELGAQMRPSSEQPLGRTLGWADFENGERPWVQHRGGGPGFATVLRVYPDEDLVVVIMANGTALDRDGLATMLANVDWGAEGSIRN